MIVRVLRARSTLANRSGVASGPGVGTAAARASPDRQSCELLSRCEILRFAGERMEAQGWDAIPPNRCADASRSKSLAVHVLVGFSRSVPLYLQNLSICSAATHVVNGLQNIPSETLYCRGLESVSGFVGR